jgi:acyl-coenzyme A thioesterase PaaI-like protein
MKAARLRRLLNIYPPFLFAGIRTEVVAEDFRYARVALHQRWYNRNYVGTHFGGSLYAMTDPFFMIMLMRNLGEDYLAWDRRAEIEFVRPGTGKVTAEFRITDADLSEIRNATADGGKYEHWFSTEVLDASGEIVAKVRKQVYARLKPRARPADPAAS